MDVELRSRGVLVCWVALCAVHAAAAEQHPMLLEYGVAVHWADLRHLVLSDRPSEDAALAVADYLRRHARPERPAFSLADGGRASFDLAGRYARADARLLQIWQQEVAAAGQRRDNHWAEVRRKQQRAAELRARLEQQKRAVASARSNESAAESEWLEKRYTTYDREQDALRTLRLARARLKEAERSVQTTEGELKEALKPPPPVIQPLPEHLDAAAPWLFFLYMPPMLRWAHSWADCSVLVMEENVTGSGASATQMSWAEYRRIAWW